MENNLLLKSIKDHKSLENLCMGLAMLSGTLVISCAGYLPLKYIAEFINHQHFAETKGDAYVSAGGLLLGCLGTFLFSQLGGGLYQERARMEKEYKDLTKDNDKSPHINRK